MLKLIILLGSLVMILAALIASVYLGYIFARRQIKLHPEHQLEILTVAETSVFTLLALLIAFTFSGAFERFETREMHLLTQANAFEKALHYLDVVDPKYKTILVPQIVQYINLHLDAYHEIPYMHKVKISLDQAADLEQKIWHTSVLAAAHSSNESLGQSFLEAISNFIEESHIGIDLIKIHAPPIIFFLMLGLASLGAFLIGYDSAENKQKQPLHISFYIILTTATIFIILNMEFPRVGFIHSEYFDQLIVDVRDHTNLFISRLEI